MSDVEIVLGDADRRGERKLYAMRAGRVHVDRLDVAVAWKRTKFAEEAAKALGIDPDHCDAIAARVAAEAVRLDLEAVKQASSTREGLRPLVSCMADVEPRAVSWLWPGRIAAGRLTLLVGMPGAGKSYLTTDLAARVSTGTPWPDGSRCERGSVVLVGAEDDAADTVRPRLDAHRADVRRVHILRGVVRTDGGKEIEGGFTLADVEPLRETLKGLGDCRLVVVDPIGSFLGGGTDAHRDNEVRAVLAPVAALAEETGAAVLIVAHRRKSTATFADDTALGSRAFVGLARAVWHLTHDPDAKGRRLLLPGKNNLGPEAGGLAFTIAGDPARLEWEPDPVEQTADEALAREGRSGDSESTAVDEAVAWLEEALAAGPRPAKELRRAARDDGHSERTLERAKARLRVENAPDGFGGRWLWRLPESANQTPVSSESAKEISLADSGKSGGLLADSGRRNPSESANKPSVLPESAKDFSLADSGRCPECEADLEARGVVLREGADGELLERCVACGATWPACGVAGAA